MHHIAMSNNLHALAESTAASLKTAIDSGDLQLTSQGDPGGDLLSQRLEPFNYAVMQALARLLTAG